ncbi:MAG: T9SS type A sorting domain-containing protein [Flavobacteriales bacterium]|nr:T9SS type A sorting domain-containing protein [Flavobacteriales bacterium]
MVTRYTTALSFMGLAMLASAQWVRNTPARSTFGPDEATPLRAQPLSQGQAKAGGDVVFYEDFANGLAGNNGVGAWTVSGPDGGLWFHKFTGPNGAYSDPVQEIIQSESAANGFMLYAADSANCTWAGQTPTPNATFVNWEGSLVSPTLDLSATPFVQLEFQQARRYCCGDAPYFVEVSTDGGASWPFRFDVNNGTAANAGVDIDVRSVNLSQAIAGNPANVNIRFFFDGSTAGTSHYYWQVDDVRIIELYEYDLAVTGAAATQWDPVTSLTYDSLRYSLYPFSQLRPIGLNMTVLNNGSMDQSNVTANFLVERAGTTVLDQDQTIANFPAGDIQTVFVNPDFTPPAVPGTYDVTYTISSGQVDNTPNDNDGDASFGVAEFDYARDLGTVASFEDGNGNNDPYELCNGFHISSATDLYGIKVALRNGGTGTVGLLIRGTLRAGDLTTIIAQTQEHEIVASDLNGANGNKFIPLVFDTPQPLDAASDYIVCIEHFGGGQLRMGQNGVSEEQSSFIYFDGPSGLDWYFTTTTPMIRMTFDPTVSINEADRVGGVGLGQNMPNPADESTAVTFELKESSATTLELRDLSGKVIRMDNLGNRGAGAHRVTINTADLTEGVYFYTLTAAGQRLSKRMVVVH